MEISAFFNPVEFEQLDFTMTGEMNCIGKSVIISRDFDPGNDATRGDIVLLGVNEDRYAVRNSGCASAPNEIRKYLYQLSWSENSHRIFDLGDIMQGNTIDDTYFALKNAMTVLLNAGLMPVVIGGSHDLAWPMYLAYESLGKIINMVNIDSMFDLARSDEYFDSHSFLSKIILHKPNHLFNFANIGYQSYFVDKSTIKLMNQLFFDVHRLGVVREHLEDTEPIIRNADLLTFDISAVRQSDAPANGNVSPNGFYGEEACQLMWYAGLNDKLSSIGIFELNPSLDNHGQTAHLVAQMIWYFLDGYLNRQGDYPDEGQEFMKYIVDLTGHKENITFIKSKTTDRWWMQIPVAEHKESRFRGHMMVPCSYKDYQMACKNEIPDCWWQTYQKLL